MNNLKLIVITRPQFFEGETALVNAMFGQGLMRLHLRKPQATEEELAEWIGQIDEPFRQSLVLHDHHKLSRTMHLGGIHLNSRNPEAPEWVSEAKRERSFTVSRSCHSISEIRQHRDSCDYLFLSPIYDSISKEGYGAAFSREELEEARSCGLLSDNVYALGGVSLDKLPELLTYGFYGAAILGDLWNFAYDKQLLLSRLKNILYYVN